jgi:hypothetical protein
MADRSASLPWVFHVWFGLRRTAGLMGFRLFAAAAGRGSGTRLSLVFARARIRAGEDGCVGRWWRSRRGRDEFAADRFGPGLLEMPCGEDSGGAGEVVGHDRGDQPVGREHT